MADRFVLEFFQPPQMDEDEGENPSLGAIGIRFRNSGSRYEPFNVIFMRMFQNLQNVDDVKYYNKTNKIVWLLKKYDIIFKRIRSVKYV